VTKLADTVAFQQNQSNLYSIDMMFF